MAAKSFPRIERKAHVEHALSIFHLPLAILRLLDLLLHVHVGLRSEPAGNVVRHRARELSGKGRGNRTDHVLSRRGPSRPGALGPDGGYTLTTFRDGDGALLGKHRVTIEAKQVSGPPPPKSFTEESPGHFFWGSTKSSGWRRRSITGKPLAPGSTWSGGDAIILPTLVILDYPQHPGYNISANVAKVRELSFPSDALEAEHEAVFVSRARSSPFARAYSLGQRRPKNPGAWLRNDTLVTPGG